MAAPVGSLNDLQILLENPDSSNVFEKRGFHFYGVLLYTSAKGKSAEGNPEKGLNESLHKYIIDHYEFFNVQTGPNWLVAILEDIGRRNPFKRFKPEDVYRIARYLGAPVDTIPAIVFFTEPKERQETLVLRLSNILDESEEIKDEKFTNLFGKLATIIDKICEEGVPADKRLESLRKAISQAWPNSVVWGDQSTSSIQQLKTVYDEINRGVLEHLHDIKVGLDTMAKKKTQLTLWTVIAVYIAAVIILVLLTIKFTWNVMEPWTYFIGISFTIIGYIYLAATKKELSPLAIFNKIICTNRERIYLSAQFDLERYNNLKERIGVM